MGACADFNFWQVSPVDALGWAVLGEASSKWVGVSNKRIIQMQESADGPELRVRGAPSEMVEFSFWNVHTKNQLTRTCTLSAEGFATISTAEPGCK